MKKTLIISIIALIVVIAAVIIFLFFRQEKVSDKQITITVGDKSFTAVLYDNKTADELYSRLPLTLNMSELNGNEKYYNFDKSFSTDSKIAGHISVGDLKLYGDDCLVLFYDSFTSGYSYTNIGYIEDTNGLAEALGSGNVTVEFSTGEQNLQDDSASVTNIVTTASDDKLSEITTTTTKPTETTAVTTEQTTVETTAATEETTIITEDISEEKVIYMEINGTPVTVEWEDNESVAALRELCGNAPLTIQMSMYGGFEQVGPIGTSLSRNDVQITTSSGDIVLYSGNQIVVFYGSNSWSYTKLGHITDSSGYTMEELLGNGDVSIKISLS